MKTHFKSDISKFLQQLEQAGILTGVTAEEELRRSLDEIEKESLNQVPRDTQTLANSIYTEMDVVGGIVRGAVGYGRGDPINPKNGKKVSEYVLKVHEDLTVIHPIGKAKFLEDPTRAQRALLIERYGAKIHRGLRATFRKGV